MSAIFSLNPKVSGSTAVIANSSPRGNILKIDQPAKSLNSVSNPANVAPNKDSVPRAAANDAAATGAASQVSALRAAAQTPLTGKVRQLQSQLLQPGTGDFDAARVAEIRQAISDGRYQVNPEKIADGLLDTVRDLLGKRSS